MLAIGLAIPNLREGCTQYSPTLKRDWKMLVLPSALILFVETQIEVLQPLDLLVCVILGPLRTNHILDQDASISMKFVSPVAVSLASENLQVFRLKLRCASHDSGCCGGHCCSEWKEGCVSSEAVNSRS
jgi:hypothetical protein